MLLEVVICACAETVFYLHFCFLFLYISLLFLIFFSNQCVVFDYFFHSLRCFTVFHKLHNRGTFGVSASGSNSQ